MAWKKTNDPKRFKKGQIILAFVLLLALIIIGLIMWRIYNDDSESGEIEKSNQNSVNQQPQEAGQNEVNQFDKDALQTVLDDWVKTIPGSASVVIADESGDVLAVSNPSESYFAASLYKLFVAYFGYQQIDSGQVNGQEEFLDGNTRIECLDLMIRDSNSPCAEKLWAELGKQELTNKLTEIGITNTSMTAITTTAGDSAKILSMILNGEGLSDESRSAYLDSMLKQDQIYRRGLPSGFPETINVYNKVGWNEQKEWHDTAIVELPDGRKLIITVLSESVGSGKIKSLGEEIYSSLSI